jgi:hypothetical protein
MQLAGRLFALACAWTAVVVGFVVLLATTADGRGVETKVHIQQVSGKRAYHGRVISNRAACISGRRIALHHEISGPDPVVARTTSAADGTWRVPVARSEYRHASFYYARIGAKPLSGGRCAAAKSAYAQAF